MTKIILVIFFHLSIINASDNVLEIKSEGISFLGSGLTEKEARQIAIELAKVNALEKAGTYFESHSIVENNILTKDEIITFTGSFLKVSILNEERTIENGMFAYKVNILASIDIETLREKLNEYEQKQDLRYLLAKEKERNKKLLDLLIQINSEKVKKEKVANFFDFMKARDWFNKGINSDNILDKIDFFSIAIELDPNYAQAYTFRGLAHWENSEYLKSINDCSEAIKLDSNDYQALVFRGNSYYAIEKYLDSINDYSAALRVTDQSSSQIAYTYYARAIAYKKLGENLKAELDFKASIEHDKKYNLIIEVWKNQHK